MSDSLPNDLTPTPMSGTASHGRGMEVTQETVVTAAARCFEKFGVAKTTMGDVAELIGIKRPNLYRLVKNKEELLNLVHRRQSDAIDAYRRSLIPLEGPVGDIIVESLLVGVMQTRASGAFIMSQESLAIAADLLAAADGDEADEGLPNAGYWYPILNHGRRRDEIRADVTDLEILHWIGRLTLQFVAYPALYPDAAQLRWYVQVFVLPALLKQPSTTPATAATP